MVTRKRKLESVLELDPTNLNFKNPKKKWKKLKIDQDHFNFKSKLELESIKKFQETIKKKKDFSPRVRQREHIIKIGKRQEEDPQDYIDPCIEYNDPYYWLRDDTRKNRRVLNYLESENKYTQYYLKDTKELQKELFENLQSRIKETNISLPYPKGEGDFNSKYQYFTKRYQGKDYPEYWRLSTETNKKEKYLDHNLLAKDHQYCDLGSIIISYDHRYLFYTVDYQGNENYQLKIIDLENNQKEILHTLGDLKFSHLSVIQNTNDIYYLKYDQTDRAYQVWKYDFEIQEKTLLLEELDPLYSVSYDFSPYNDQNNQQYLLLISSSYQNCQIQIVKLKDSKIVSGKRISVVEKKDDIKASIEIWRDKLIILSNKETKKSYKVYWTSLNHPRVSSWKKFPCLNTLPETSFFKFNSKSNSKFNSKSVLDQNLNQASEVDFQEFSCYHNFIIFRVKIEDQDLVYLARYINGSLEDKWTLLSNLNNPLEDWGIACGFYNSNHLWIYKQSPVIPYSIYQAEVNFNNTDSNVLIEKDLLYQKKVPNYNSDLYQAERLYIQGHDQELIPISLLRKKTTILPAPTYLYGYGSYGTTIDCPPTYSASVATLLDAGFVYVIAHVRGGSMRGEKWYLDGKMDKKLNTFKDFISVAEYLKNSQITRKNKLAIEGRSAGGLLVGSVYVQRPDLFDVVIAGVPFLDVITTMSDPSIPLTNKEWLQWGNSNILKDYQNMIQYSPYDNLKKGINYPPILITAGLNDPRVQYWEPAKFMAKLRNYSDYQDGQIHLLKTEMDSGHFGNTGRYQHLKKKAEEYAFIIKVLS